MVDTMQISHRLLPAQYTKNCSYLDDGCVENGAEASIELSVLASVIVSAMREDYRVRCETSKYPDQLNSCVQNTLIFVLERSLRGYRR